MLGSYLSILYSKQSPQYKPVSVSRHLVPCLDTLAVQCQVFSKGGVRIYIYKTYPLKEVPVLFRKIISEKHKNINLIPKLCFFLFPKLTALSPKMPLTTDFTPF